MLKSVLQQLFLNVGHKGRKMLMNNITGSCACSSYTSYHPFKRMFTERLSEAKNSVVIKITSEKSLNKILNLCSTFGCIKFAGLQKYTQPAVAKTEKQSIPNNPEHCIIVEFKNEQSVHKLIEVVQKNTRVPHQKYNIPFFIFTEENDTVTEERTDIPLTVQSNCNDDVIIEESAKQNSFSDEIQYYYDSLKLTDVGSRLRFLACRKVQLCVPRFMFPGEALPFGSSINSFGRYDCDIDINLLSHDPGSSSRAPMAVPKFPLVCITNGNMVDPHPHITKKRTTNVLLKMILPSLVDDFHLFYNSFPILTATVPIVKCKESITGIDCDITALDSDGLQMTELLYTFGCFDARVRPLVFFIRRWASDTSLSEQKPFGRVFSNFTITCFVLFYLMRTSPPVLPSYHKLQNMLKKTPNGELPPRRIYNNESLEVLFCNFFRFYKTLDFSEDGLSLTTGKTVPTRGSNMYIENPVETRFNITKNVSKQEAQGFYDTCYATHEVITASCDKLREPNWDQSRLSYIVDNIDKVQRELREGDDDHNDISYLFDSKKLADKQEKKTGIHFINTSFTKRII